ncbi:MAG: hypothetical protein ACUVX8_09005 [Candidatus Zipacnadales bacterium]
MDRLVPIVLLKVRLTLRQARGLWNIIGIILLVLLFVVPLGMTLAAFTFAGLNSLERDRDTELLHLVFGGLWLFWLIFPLIGFSLNQSYDLIKLFIYPLSKRLIFVANLLGCLLDPTLLIVLPVCGVVLFFYAGSVWGALITTLALFLFVVHTIAFSQAVLWGLMNILRSRRIRDWVILLAPGIALAIYMAPQLLAQGASGPAVFEVLLRWRPSRYLGYTPPGMAVHAIEAADRLAWGPALGYLGAAAGYVLAAIWAGGWVLGQLYVGELGAYALDTASVRQRGIGAFVQRCATTPRAVLALKEARYYWREPRLKSMFIAPLFPLIVLFGGVLTHHPIPPAFGIGLAAGICLFGFGSLFQNIFGIDREGLRLLFVMPCPREDILIGKNVAAVAVATIATSGAVMVAGLLLHELRFALTCIPFVLPAALVLAAVGNIVSIHFPIRTARRGENPFTSSSGRGCLTGIINMLAFQISVLMASPILWAAALPALLDAPLMYIPMIPAAGLYGIGVYMGLLRYYTAAALEQNEPRILEECLVGEVGA